MPVLYLLHGGGGDRATRSAGRGAGGLRRRLSRGPAGGAHRRHARRDVDASWFDRLVAGRATRTTSPAPHRLRRPPLPHDRRPPRPGDRRPLERRPRRDVPRLRRARPVRGGRRDVGNIGWQSFTGGAELNKRDSPAWFTATCRAPGRQPRRARPHHGHRHELHERRARTPAARRLRAGLPRGQPRVRRRARGHAPRRRPRLPRDRGGHSWRWWPKWLGERQLPFLLQRLDDPQPAGARSRTSGPRLPFRYRSVQTAFSVYGYDVEVARKAREFLDLSGVGGTG